MVLFTFNDYALSECHHWVLVSFEYLFEKGANINVYMDSGYKIFKSTVDIISYLKQYQVL